jgi:carboxymethylenebutenolidase
MADKCNSLAAVWRNPDHSQIIMLQRNHWVEGGYHMTDGQYHRGIEAVLRRTGALLIAAGLAAAATLCSAQAGVKVTQEDVVIKTPDGSAEAVLYHPAAKGKWPAVLLWPDFVGLRPAFRDLARKFAAEGYVVLLPNSFYRSMRPNDAELNPRDPAIRPTLTKYREEATDDGIARDASAYIAFLDAQTATDRKRKAAVIGYDLGGSYAFRTAAALPDRISAVGSIYGLGVATPRPNSPHLLAPKSKAAYYVALARDDDTREPEDKADIRKVIEEARLQGTVDVYPADHDWANPASKAYDPVASERAFQALVALLKSRLK